MELETLPGFIGRGYARAIRRLEKDIGYRLAFPECSDMWIPEFMTVDLTRAWRKFDIDATGVDYFTMGRLGHDGISSRFDPQAPQYQAWLGGYLVRFGRERAWSLEDHIDLAVVDQLDWLRDYGDPKSLCDLSPEDFKEIDTATISGYPAKLYRGGGYSHSDIGPGNAGLGTRLRLAAMASVLNARYPGKHFAAHMFLPKIHGSYEKLFLSGYIVDIEIEQDVRCVLYGNGIFLTDGARETDTFAFLKDDILGTLRGARIEKIA